MFESECGGLEIKEAGCVCFFRLMRERNKFLQELVDNEPTEYPWPECEEVEADPFAISVGNSIDLISVYLAQLIFMPTTASKRFSSSKKSSITWTNYVYFLQVSLTNNGIELHILMNTWPSSTFTG
jgi:uncharacterized protein (DUF1015 family)